MAGRTMWRSRYPFKVVSKDGWVRIPLRLQKNTPIDKRFKSSVSQAEVMSSNLIGSTLYFGPLDERKVSSLQN